MRNHVKKARSMIAVVVTGLVIACFGLLWTSSAGAQAEGRACSNRTLRGDYAFVIDGQILGGPNPGLLRAVAMTTFDGDGNLEQVDFATVNGIATGSEWRPATGTYEVSANCTGEATITPVVGPPLELRLVVANKGALIHSRTRERDRQYWYEGQLT